MFPRLENNLEKSRKFILETTWSFESNCVVDLDPSSLPITRSPAEAGSSVLG